MVDNTIALQVRPFQMPDIGQIYGQAQNIQLNRMRMAEAQETAQERNALRGLLSSGIDLNTPEGIAQLRRVAPTLSPQFEQAASQRAYQTAQIGHLRAQTDVDRFKLYRGQLGGVNDQASWDNWRSRVVQEFPQFAGSIPERFSPQARLEVAGGAELLIQRATAADRPPVSVAAGSSLVDPRTGRVIFTAPARPQDQAPISVAPGNSVIDRAGNVIFTAPARPQDQSPISVAPGNSVIDRSGNVLFTAPERAPSPVSVAPGGTLVNPRTGEPVFTSPDRPPPPVSVAPGGTLVNPRTGEPVFTAPERAPSLMSVAPGNTVIDPTTRQPVFTAPERPQATPAREQRIADTMATFGVDRATALGLVDNIIEAVQGSAGEPPVFVNKLTREIITPRMGAAQPAAALTIAEAPAINLRRPPTTVPGALPTNMMLPSAPSANMMLPGTTAVAPTSVEDLYACRRQRQVQQAGATAEAQARGQAVVRGEERPARVLEAGQTTGAQETARLEARSAATRREEAAQIERGIAELRRIAAPGGLLERSTGSGIGAIRDNLLAFFGASTEGAQAAAQLRPIADVILKLVPRFEGPQSNADLQSYQRAAGQLDNEALPNATRMAAAREILRLMEARQNQFSYNASGSGSPAATTGRPPPPAVGAVVDGYRFRGGDPSNPRSWERQ